MLDYLFLLFSLFSKQKIYGNEKILKEKVEYKQSRSEILKKYGEPILYTKESMIYMIVKENNGIFFDSKESYIIRLQFNVEDELINVNITNAMEYSKLNKSEDAPNIYKPSVFKEALSSIGRVDLSKLK